MLLPSRSPRARSRRFPILVTLTVLVATVFTSTASAASVRRTWKTQLGANGANGTAILTAYWAGSGALGLKLVGLQPSTTYPVIAYRGSCAKPILITRLPGAVTDATGAVIKTSTVSIRIMNSIWA